MEEFITVCPRNCYSTCSFTVETENNRIVRILPYPGNKATPFGPCIKGLSYIERSASPDRIKHPLLKMPDGTFRRISPDEALTLLSTRLLDIRSRYGPNAVLWLKGSGQSGLLNETGTAFWKAFGGATTTYGNLCWPAGLEAVRLTLGSVKHNVPWDIENARTIVVWGKNPAETNIQEMTFISRARENGCRLIVIDSRKTPTADKADIFICPKPGTDAALALFMAKVIIENNLTDNDFIDGNVKGYEGFKESLATNTNDVEYITGIPEPDARKIALMIAKGGPVTFLPGYGVQRHKNGGQTIRSILSLAIITGNLGREGAGFNYANLQGYIFDDILEPESYYPVKERDLPFRRTIPIADLGRAMLSTNGPEIKMAWIERGNPLLQVPGTGYIEEAFKKLEFIVVIEQFMTDTAKMAHLILPAKDIFEQADIVSSYWSPYIQYKPKVLVPEGDILPESELYFKLSEIMKLNPEPGSIPAPGDDNCIAWLAKRISGNKEISLDILKNGPVLAPGLQQIAYEDHLFTTKSGKIELYSEEASDRWGVSPLPEYVPVSEYRDHRFPLFFITPNTGSRIHSQFGNLNAIKDVSDSPSLWISQTDAEKRKIKDGDVVKVVNQNAAIITEARISDRVPEGIVSLPNGIWKDEGGGGNYLVSPQETDMGHGVAFHDTMVEVVKAVENG